MFVYPGQGSQQPGMGKFLFDNFKTAKELYDEGSDIIKLNLKELCFTSDEKTLALTENTQPALLVTSVSTAQVLIKELGIRSFVGAGHSIGEYAALVISEVISFQDAIRAVRVRGQAMQAAVPVGQGGMAAIIGIESDKTVVDLCKHVVEKSGQGPLTVANFNCPGQIIISGSLPAINWLRTEFKPEDFWGQNEPKQFKIIPLKVSAPFHCAMMKPAEDKMREVLNAIEFKDAKFGVLQNFTGRVELEAAKLRENLIKQVSAPVLWTQSMEEARTQGVMQAIECGNGKVLAGLLKKLSADFEVFPTGSLEDLNLIVKTFKG